MGVVPHDDKPLQFLRRTCQTRLEEAGVPEWMINRIVGHSSRVGQQSYNGMTPVQVARQVADLGGEV